MTSDSQSSTKKLAIAIDQNWEHARHAERARFWFASVYSAIVAGTLAVVSRGVPANPVTISGRTYPTTILVIVSFLGLLAVAGIFVTVKLGLVFHHYNAHARRVAEQLGIDRAIATPLYDHPDPKIETSIVLSVGPWFLAIYLLSLSGLVGWAYYTVTDDLGEGALASVVVLAVVCVVTFGYSIYKMQNIDRYVDSLTEDEQTLLERLFGG